MLGEQSGLAASDMHMHMALLLELVRGNAELASDRMRLNAAQENGPATVASFGSEGFLLLGFNLIEKV